MVVYRQPSREDLARNLSAVHHSAHHKARKEKGRLVTTHAARGILDSSMFVSAVVEYVDSVHAESVTRAMNVVNEFAGPLDAPAGEIGGWARPHLENISNTLLGLMMPQGQQSVTGRHFAESRDRYRAVFQQRVDNALRGFEVGFIGGRSIRPAASRSIPDLLQLRPGIWGMSLDLKEALDVGWMVAAADTPLTRQRSGARNSVDGSTRWPTTISPLRRQRS